MKNPLELNQKSEAITYRCWAGYYVPFWDGYDYNVDYSDESFLIKDIEEHYGPDWKCLVEIHKIKTTYERVA